MKTERLIVFVLVIFLFPYVSIADTVHIYGLTDNAKVNASDANLLKSVKLKLEAARHTVTSSYNVSEKKFKNITADWIIFVGHGVSCSGRISRNADGSGLIHPKYLSWKAKGVLLFACSVIDIGDFGGNFGTKISYCDPADGNYCKNYYDKNVCVDKEIYKNINPAFPDPGLGWEQMAKINGIDYILGFNFKAPEVSSVYGKKVAEGYDLLEKLIDNWISKGIDSEDSFIESWKSDLSSSEQSQDDRDRGYLRCGGTYHHQCDYSLGRKGIWPRVWGKDGYKNWEESIWQYVTEMTVTDYRKCLFTGFDNEAEMHARELCLRGIVNGYEEFNLTDKVNYFDLPKILARASAIEINSNVKIDFDDLCCDCVGVITPEYYKQYCQEDYIKILKAANVIQGTKNNEGVFFVPPENSWVTRSYLYSYVVAAFFGGHPENECSSYGNLKNIKDSSGWFCHSLAAVINCKIIDPTSENDQKLFGISKQNIYPSHEVTRDEVAVVVNRARRLKEAGVTTCYP